MKSLRLKFVLFAMAAVSVLLLILGISINGLAWYMFEQQADEMMETLIDSDGNFMQHRRMNRKRMRINGTNFFLRRWT